MDADVIWRDIVTKETSGNKTCKGLKRKLAYFKGRRKTNTATIFKGSASTLRRKKFPEDILTKEFRHVLSHLLLGGDSTSEQRAEAILSVTLVLAAA